MRFADECEVCASAMGATRAKAAKSEVRRLVMERADGVFGCRFQAIVCTAEAQKQNARTVQFNEALTEPLSNFQLD